MSTTAHPPVAGPRPAAETPPALLRPGIRLGVIVVIACVCGFMAVMDSSIVNVALPSIRTALGLSTTTQAWVINAYLLTLGGLLLLGARASDLYGRRRVLQIGIAIFTVGSLLGGVATSGGMLLAARAIQGVGGAVLAPSGMALILATHPDGQARGRAIATYASSASVAAIVGVLVGGVLTQALSWRWVMFINVPVGIALFLAVALCLVPSARRSRGQRLDWVGALTVTVGVGSLMKALSDATGDGWGAAQVWVELSLAAVLLAVFVIVESRVTQPLVRLGVLTERNVWAGCLVITSLGLMLTASTFFLSLILQSGMHNSALGAGLRLAPLAAGATVGSLGPRVLVPKFGARAVLLAGSLLGALGFGWLGLMGSDPSYVADLLGPMVLVGVGLGLIVMPAQRVAAAGISHHEAGLASGLFSMSRQIGAAVGLAALAALASVTGRGWAGEHDSAAAQMHGSTMALLACAIVCVAAAGLSLLLRTSRPGTETAT